MNLVSRLTVVALAAFLSVGPVEPAAPEPIAAPLGSFTDEQEEPQALDTTPTARRAEPGLYVTLPARTVQIEAPEGAWGIRRFAREADRQIPGLRIFTQGKCADRPAAVCVRVKVDSWDEAEMEAITPGMGWYGLTSYPAPMLRVVFLNTFNRDWNLYSVAAHEFGHVLGLNHHERLGVCGRTPDVVHLSYGEKRVIRGAYPV